MLVVNPNLCFDVTVRLPVLVPGAVLRASATETTPGGKGVNVIRASRTLGTTGQRLLGFLPAQDGAQLAQLLAAEGTSLRGVGVEGAVRIATILLEDSGRSTVVNGRGPDISAAQWQALVSAVSDELRAGEVLVCSGSLPPGVPADGYAQLVALAHSRGCPTVVDAAPAPLLAALSESPDLVSPNLSEAEGLLTSSTTDRPATGQVISEQVDETGEDIPDRALRAAVELHRRGAVRAVVTAGSSGAALATATGTWWLTSPRAVVVSPIGAGDSFVGGAAPLLERAARTVADGSAVRSAGGSVVRSAASDDVALVVRGMAAASASVEQQLAGGLDPARAAEFATRITTHLIDQSGVPR